MTHTPSPEALKRYIESNNLTSRGVGELLDVDSRLVRNWMNGRGRRGVPTQISAHYWNKLRAKIAEREGSEARQQRDS